VFYRYSTVKYKDSVLQYSTVKYKDSTVQVQYR